MSVDEGSQMPKVQKTFLLHQDLARLTDAHGKRTGATFTRMVTAAVLQYLFTHPDGPQDIWMEHAVALELGEIGVGDLPAQRMNDISVDLIGHVGSMAKAPGSLPKEIDPAYRKLWQEWRSIADAPAKDPVDKIIMHWIMARKR